MSYPNTPTFKREVEEWRGFLGRYGVTGKMQTTRIGELSEGQKSRIVFAMLCMARPNMVRDRRPLLKAQQLKEAGNVIMQRYLSSAHG